MKKREGFVSNSSSASFVVYWRCLKQDEDENHSSDVDEAIDGIFKWSKEVSEYLKANTKETSSAGTYATTGWVSMYNDITDFPEEIAYLVLGLKVEAGFELIDVRVEQEG